MSKYDKNSTSRLPLVESVIIIAIFAVVSVAIMQLYVSADRLQQKSVNISKATILLENRAEELRAEVMSEAVSEIYYDEQWNRTDKNNAEFCMKTELTESEEGKTGILCHYRLSAYQTDNPGEPLAEFVTACDYLFGAD